MNNKQITTNFLLAPTNIGGVITNKIDTTNIDPVELFLYNAFNAMFVTATIYLLFERFYGANVGFTSAGIYLLMTFLLGIIVGPVDTIDILN